MPALSVATLNLYGLPFRVDERASLVVQGLQQLRPNVIGLQEVNLTLDNGNRICASLNQSLRDEGGPRYRIYHVSNPGRTVAQAAQAVMTHLSLLLHESFDYLVEELQWNCVAQRVRVDLGAEAALDFYNTHLHYQLGDEAEQIRCRQATRLVDWMDSHGWTVPKVLVGDFNAWPDSEPVRMLKEKLLSCYELVHGSEPAKTWPTPIVRQPNAPDWTLDYIFVTHDVRVSDARVVFDQPDPADPTLYPSDHYGLAATIEVG